MTLRTRVKICGITRVEDGVQAASLGADAIGLVFYQKSKRCVSLQQASDICAALPAMVTTVALFLDAQQNFIEQVLARVPIDLIQFHGSETADFCASFPRPYIKALGMQDNHRLQMQCDEYAEARGILLDSHGVGAAGGTGETFDWSLIPETLRNRIILAGGLQPSNVGEAIRRVRPYGIDLSSGVESAPGIKDATLMAQLMKEVKRVDCEHE